MKVLFCTDESSASLFALEKTMPFLKKDSIFDILRVMELTFLITSDPYEFKDDVYVLKEKISKNLDKTVNYIKSCGFKTEKTIIDYGEPAEHILKHIYEDDYGLVVMGAHGKKGINKWLGSISRKIATKSPQPLLIARPHEKPDVTSEEKKVLFAVDGSECSYNSVSRAVELLDFENSKIEILCVKEGAKELPSEITQDKEWLARILTKEENLAEEIIKRTEELFSEKGIKTNSRIILEGNPSEEILKYLENQKKDLIIMGSHGREGISQLLLGSVSKRILEHSPAPVLIIPTKRVRHEYHQ